ncbi:hypothetical protein DFH09DRAFT_357189 [Mycena vulgaris]|nr:hypothetical protein DFH09DRAFT_357189 [Mycena vulgaris]
MDPITATTAIVTLATFIKDLIDVGQSIKRSIDKVSENRRRIRDLTDDILRVLAEMAELSRKQAGQSHAPALLSALGDLKADMLYVLSACRKISPAQPSPGIRSFGSQIKVWIKRDDIEAKIRRLKEHVNKCYLEFTAFSAVRIEQTTTRINATAHRTEDTTLRVEQTLIANHVENQVKLKQLEGLMARVLLETQFGQDVMSRTIEIIVSDKAHQTLEFQYLSAQALRLANVFQQLTAKCTLVLDTPLWNGAHISIQKSVSPENVLFQILGLMLMISPSPAEIPFTSIEGILRLGSNLAPLGMISEAICWHHISIQILRRLSGGALQSNSGVLPDLALSFTNLSRRYQCQSRWDLATETSQQALDVCRLWGQTSPDVDHHPLLAAILITHSENLRLTGKLKLAVSTAQENAAVCRGFAGQLISSALESSSSPGNNEQKAMSFCLAFLALAAALSSADRCLEAYEAAKEGFQAIAKFPIIQYPLVESEMDRYIDQICQVAEADGLSLSMLADNVILFRDLARIYPKQISPQFLRTLHAYTFFSQQYPPDFGNLRVFLEPSSDSPPLVLSNLKVKMHDFELYGGDAIRAYYCSPWAFQDGFPLIKNIFIFHFDQAVTSLLEITSKLMTDPDPDPEILDWVLGDISDILPFVTRAQELVLLEIMAKIRAVVFFIGFMDEWVT